MALQLVPYSDILIKDLSQIKELIQDVIDDFGIPPMTTELLKYENHLYVSIDKSKYVGFIMPKLGDEVDIAFHEIPKHEGEFWLVRGMFIDQYYQDIGIEFHVYQEFFKNRLGMLRVSPKQYELKKIIKELGFWNIKEDIYTNIPCY